jgi:hypothetical protein
MSGCYSHGSRLRCFCVGGFVRPCVFLGLTPALVLSWGSHICVGNRSPCVLFASSARQLDYLVVPLKSWFCRSFLLIDSHSQLVCSQVSVFTLRGILLRARAPACFILSSHHLPPQFCLPHLLAHVTTVLLMFSAAIRIRFTIRFSLIWWLLGRFWKVLDEICVRQWDAH